MRAAVVTTDAATEWDDAGLVTARFVGALACIADVDVLLAHGPDRRTSTHGATTMERFPTPPVDVPARRALELIAFGPSVEPFAGECACLSRARRRIAGDLGRTACEAIAASQGSASPFLSEHLEATAYDVVVLSGYRSEAVRDALDRVRSRAATILISLARPEPQFWLSGAQKLLESVDAVATASSFEHRLVTERAPSVVAHETGIVLRVHDLVLKNRPLLYDDTPMIAVTRDWRALSASSRSHLVRLARRLNHDLAGEGAVRMLGPGWERLPDVLRTPHADSRLDTWRWLARAVAMWDPEPGRLLGRDVLEAMMFGVPVVVPTSGGATQVHAQHADGGLWYRSYDELLSCLRFLLSEREAAATLGQQGHIYAMREYGDTTAYVERVQKLVESVVA